MLINVGPIRISSPRYASRLSGAIEVDTPAPSDAVASSTNIDVHSPAYNTTVHAENTPHTRKTPYRLARNVIRVRSAWPGVAATSRRAVAIRVTPKISANTLVIVSSTGCSEGYGVLQAITSVVRK